METALIAEFFGMPLAVSAPGLTELLRFHLGTHLRVPGQAGPEGRPGALDPDRARAAIPMTVRPVPGSSADTGDRKPLRAGLPLEVHVLDAAGAPLLSRVWRSWGNLPPPVPPFALWPDRFAVAPAIVLAKGDTTVALSASPDARHVATTIALANRGWRFVSGSVLVIELDSGAVLPCHLPLQASGSVGETLRATGLPAGTWRSYPSALAHDVLLVRPEAIGEVVAIDARLPPPTLIRVCPSRGENVTLEPDGFRPPAWPAEARKALAELAVLGLAVPEGGAPEAARLIERQLAPRPQRWPPVPSPDPPPNQEEPCRSGSTTRPARRAGSTGSPRT